MANPLRVVQGKDRDVGHWITITQPMEAELALRMVQRLNDTRYTQQIEYRHVEDSKKERGEQ